VGRSVLSASFLALADACASYHRILAVESRALRAPPPPGDSNGMSDDGEGSSAPNSAPGATPTPARNENRTDLCRLRRICAREAALVVAGLSETLTADADLKKILGLHEALFAARGLYRELSQDGESSVGKVLQERSGAAELMNRLSAVPGQ
jgi:hypothetical protein